MTARDVALSEFAQVRAMGRGDVLGGDMVLATEARLTVARCAARAIEAAFGTERSRLGGSG